MPRKSKKTRGRPRKIAVAKPVDIKRKWFRWGESYTNVLLGIIVVIIGTLFVASIAKTHHTVSTSSTSTVAITEPVSPTETNQQSQNNQNTKASSYTVRDGDSLWSIAEDTYHSGYNWVDIAKANNLTNPDEISAGTTLVLPKVTSTLVTPTPQSKNNEQTITTNTYVIQHGDNLWDIAVRAYADGYKWTELAKANNLQNPDLIFSGNTLQIPR